MTDALLRDPSSPAKVKWGEIATPPNIWLPPDHGLKAWAFDPTLIRTGAKPTAGTLYLVRLPIREATGISKLWTQFTGAGSSDIANCFMALFQNGKLLGQSADQAANWKTTGAKNATITEKEVAAGFIEVGLWFGSATTAPEIGLQTTSSPNLNLSGQSLRVATADTGLTTVAPGEHAAKVAITNGFWAGVS